ncbi:hypothetical protein B0H11DRAFT_1987207 [Mycena galericulata]|nr:hypothetical protein B0H11DRAFT_1987207 [Mycena galericulata]
MSSPPAKRQRTENAPITRSEIWHDDGSIVLQAENTQFRVHWGVLSLNSSFFRDMKGLPQPPDQPNVDGCPIVELSDTEEDVQYLLKALYSPTFMTQKALPFPAVAALIRLGRKYDFRELLESAVERITLENPTTLEEYGALTPVGVEYRATRIVHYSGLLTDILTVARENNILSALPCAYYRLLMKYPRAEILDGLHGTLASIDARKCVLGREKLAQAQWQTGNTLEWLKLDSVEYVRCASPQRCGSYRSKRRDSFLTRGFIAPFDLPPPTTHGGLCEMCWQHIKESMIAGRKKMWDELPGFLDLPAWSELKNDL